MEKTDRSQKRGDGEVKVFFVFSSFLRDNQERNSVLIEGSPSTDDVPIRIISLHAIDTKEEEEDGQRDDVYNNNNTNTLLLQQNLSLSNSFTLFTSLYLFFFLSLSLSLLFSDPTFVGNGLLK